MSDMILSASLRREGFSLRRGTAMNDNQCDGPHKFTYSFVLLSTTYSSSDSDDYFDNETPNGTDDELLIVLILNEKY